METNRRLFASAIHYLTSNRDFMARAFSFYAFITSREAAARIYRKEARRLLSIAERVDPVDGRRPVKVPKLPGIDENMRCWSIYMTLEHLSITNEMMIRIIRSLAREKPFMEFIDFEKEVMPSENPGSERIADFRASVAFFEKNAARFGKSKSKTIFTHPVFGPFDIHKWRCMAGFHLYIHRRQVEKIYDLLQDRGPGPSV